MLDSAVCPVCHDYMFVPITTPCGHTYCYTCLKSWFTSDTTGGKLNCPECRTTMTNIPTLNSVMQNWVGYVFELLGNKKADDDRFKTLNKTRLEDIEQYRRDKDAGELFDNIFEQSAEAIADEDDDGIIRCSNCMWELEDDSNYCPRCTRRIRNNVPRSNGRSESTADRGYDASEYSEGEYEEMEEGLRREENDRHTGRSSFGLPEGYDEDDFYYSEDDENPGRGSSAFSNQNMRSRISLHDDEAEDDEDEDGESTAKLEDEENDAEEHDSDLDSFIVDDDEELEEDDEEDDDGAPRVHEIPSESDRDSDYERRQDEFVEGDSLAEDSDDDGNEDGKRTLELSDQEGSDNEDTGTAKRKRRFRVVLDDEEDDDE